MAATIGAGVPLGARARAHEGRSPFLSAVRLKSRRRWSFMPAICLGRSGVDVLLTLAYRRLLHGNRLSRPRRPHHQYRFEPDAPDPNLRLPAWLRRGRPCSPSPPRNRLFDRRRWRRAPDRRSPWRRGQPFLTWTRYHKMTCRRRKMRVAVRKLAQNLVCRAADDVMMRPGARRGGRDQAMVAKDDWTRVYACHAPLRCPGAPRPTRAVPHPQQQPRRERHHTPSLRRDDLNVCAVARGWSGPGRDHRRGGAAHGWHRDRRQRFAVHAPTARSVSSPRGRVPAVSLHRPSSLAGRVTQVPLPRALYPAEAAHGDGDAAEPPRRRPRRGS